MDSLFGGSGGNSQSSSTTTPVSMTPAPYAALQSPVANTILGLLGGGGLSPTTAGSPSPISSAVGSTFTAPLTGNENSLLSQIMSLNGGLGGLTGASSYLNNVLSPNYLSSVMSNPGLNTAVNSAVAPLLSTFQNVTMPNLKGQFVANGGVLNGPSQVATNPGAQGAINPANGQGSSAFDKASAIAQSGLLQSMGSTAAPIISQFLGNAMQQQTTAASQAPVLSTTEVNNLLSTLQAEALPQMIQQYGLDQGLQQYNNNVNTLLQALGLGVQTSQPDTAESSQSTSTSGFNSGPGLVSGLLGSNTGGAFSNILGLGSSLLGGGGGGGSSGILGLFGSLLGGGGGAAAGAAGLGAADLGVGAGAAAGGSEVAELLPLLLAA